MLRLEDVYYRYRREQPQILRGVSYEFERGRSYAIVGESGSGKTTLISLLAGLDRPESGAIYYDGRNLRELNLDKYRASSVAVIFQSYNLLSHHSALDNVKMSLRLSGFRGDLDVRAHELLGYVEIPEREHSFDVAHLSGGERQRVAIARALASEASVIIADEPTGNLDPVNSANVMRLLAEQKSRGRCVIIVTHSRYVAAQCDVSLRLADGRLEQ